MAKRALLDESELLSVVQQAVNDFARQKADTLDALASEVPEGVQVSLREALHRFATDLRREHRVKQLVLDIPESQMIDDEAPTHPGRFVS